jgi:hypothetical protein
MTTPPAADPDSAQVHGQLVTALELDLIGPSQRVLNALGADAQGLETEVLDRLESLRSALTVKGVGVEKEPGRTPTVVLTLSGLNQAQGRTREADRNKKFGRLRRHSEQPQTNSQG